MNTRYSRFTCSIVFLLALVPYTTPAHPQQPAPPPRAIINFLLPINTDSVNLLLAVVNNQVRAGVKNITIVISSPGGDTTSAFAAFNILRNVPAEITTFNVGNIDSAALLIYCSGKYRYAFPSPTRFLIHGNSLQINGNIAFDANTLEAQVQQLQNLNTMVVDVLVSISKHSKADIERAVLGSGNKILSSEEAKEWGIVQEIRTTFMEPGAVFVSVNSPTVEQKPTPTLKYSTIPSVTSGMVKP